MNKGKITTKFLLLSLALTAVLFFSTAVCVFAEPDETYAIESFAQETTEAFEETLPEETYSEAAVETEGFAEETQSGEVDETEGESTAESQTQEPSSEALEPTYRAPLPTIEATEIIPPTVVGAVEDREEPSLFWGFVSWILIGVGAAVIFAVMLSTKAKTYRGGRDRYSNTDKISGKKKLLPQDYYDKRKRR